MGPTPFYGARAEKTQKADFAMKQTNICRLSGDIIRTTLKSDTVRLWRILFSICMQSLRTIEMKKALVH